MMIRGGIKINAGKWSNATSLHLFAFDEYASARQHHCVDRRRREVSGNGAAPFRPPVQMIKLTKTQEITTCKWVHPDEERRQATSTKWFFPGAFTERLANDTVATA
jgi:hypothetical protein